MPTKKNDHLSHRMTAILRDIQRNTLEAISIVTRIERELISAKVPEPTQSVGR